MAEKPGVLRNLRIKRVSLVDKGANLDKSTHDGAHIMLYKRDVTKDGPSLGQVHVDVAGKEKELADKESAARRKIEAATKNKEKSVKKNIIKQMLALFGEQDVTKRAAAVEELAKAIPDDNDEDDKVVHKADDAMCKCAECMAKRTKKSMEDATVVEKRFTDLEKRNVELEKQLTESQNIAKAERTIRLKNDMTTILKSFKATPFDMEKDVDKFLKMQAETPEAFDRTIELLKAQDAQLAKSALFSNIGSGQSGGAGSAWEQIEAKAAALVAKGGTSLTKAQAIDQIMNENVDLVRQYRAEQSGSAQ